MCPLFGGFTVVKAIWYIHTDIYGFDIKHACHKEYATFNKRCGESTVYLGKHGVHSEKCLVHSNKYVRKVPTY